MAKKTRQSADDLFGHIVGLRFTITELLQELAVDTIQEHPRTVLMALIGLEARVLALETLAGTLITQGTEETDRDTKLKDSQFI